MEAENNGSNNSKETERNQEDHSLRVQKLHLQREEERTEKGTAIMMDMEELFGPVISSYSRAQALEDGELVDVTEMAKEAGFVVPVAVTRAVYALCTPPKKSYESIKGRLWDVLFLASIGCKGAARRGDDRFQYKVKVGRRTPVLICHIGPGDDAEPVLTIMTPEDD